MEQIDEFKLLWQLPPNCVECGSMVINKYCAECRKYSMLGRIIRVKDLKVHSVKRVS